MNSPPISSKTPFPSLFPLLSYSCSCSLLRYNNSQTGVSRSNAFSLSAPFKSTSRFLKKKTQNMASLRGLDITVRAHDHSRSLASRGAQLLRRRTKAVPVPEEQDALAFTSSALAGFDPIAPSRACVHRLEETEWATFGVAAVVSAHDGFDGLGGFVGVVERDGGDVVVEDVGLDDAVEELAADEAEFAVDGCGGAAGVRPGLGRVMWEGRIRVLEEGDGDYSVVLVLFITKELL
jgi:hypothetical protein